MTRLTRKKYTCISCGKPLRQRRKTAMCKACVEEAKRRDTDNRVFAAIVTYKQANDGNTPKVEHLVKLAYTNDWTIDMALRRLEQVGRIRIVQSRAGYRQDGIIVVGGKWTYEEPTP